MLVLSRHRDESVIIGDDVVITVVDIRGDKVRLGIAAPVELSVHRQEVYEAIYREQRMAGIPSPKVSPGKVTPGLIRRRDARRQSDQPQPQGDPLLMRLNDLASAYQAIGDHDTYFALAAAAGRIEMKDGGPGA